MNSFIITKKETNGSVSQLDIGHFPFKNHQGRMVVDWKKVDNKAEIIVNDNKYIVDVKYTCTSNNNTHYIKVQYKDNSKIVTMKDFKRLHFKKLINECNTNINTNISNDCIAVKRPDLVRLFNNPEDTYTYTPGSGKKVAIRCPNCSHIRLYKIHYLTRKGRTYKCPMCSKGTSYGEKMFYVVNSLFNLGFEHKVVLDNLKHREFDFYNKDLKIAVEIHGIQHYEEGTGSFHNAYERTLESDKEKRQYCNINNIKLVEIDARFSDFNFIIKNINNSELNITIDSSYHKDILIEVDKYSNYDVKDIINSYKSNGSMERTGKLFGVSQYTIKRILDKFKVKTIKHTTKVKCTTTNRTFNSQREACNEYGIQPSNLNKVLKGVRKYTGMYNGEKLTWEYVD